MVTILDKHLRSGRAILGTVYCNYRSRCKGKRLETTPEEKRPTPNSYTLTFAIGSSKDCGVKGRRNLPARHLAVG